ncbi:MAG: UvrD-helicase domain-containing protein [Victivallales bacterium]|nr:UvrD-helicase domain-containing protein [Victivallales bacterium]
MNPEQLAAVNTTEGAVRVAAGAGTGKTQALTQRYIHIVRDLGILPKNILCATFTNRAANEMKARVRAEIGDLDLGFICTFHAFCIQLLKEDIHVLNYPKNFIILDVEDQRQILQRVFTALQLTLKDYTIQRAIDEVLEARKFQATDYIDAFYQLDNEQLRQRAEEATTRSDKIFLRYLYEQKISYGLDFNDLINFATYILQHFPDILEKWQTRMEYVLVDEFQDVSLRQYTIAKLLSGKHGNLFIVGDPDQTIYTWRGSHLKLFLDFPKEYPQAKTIILKRNYRSTPQILATGNTLIAKNAVRFPKELEAQQGAGPKPRYYHAKSGQDEAQWIVQTIQQLTSPEFEDQPYRPSQIAILYRAHYLSRLVEEQLIHAKIPYKLYSGVEFYCRAEIKDVLCYLRMVTLGDNLAFLRTIDKPARKIGRKKLERLEELARQKGSTLFEALKADLDNPVWRGTGAANYVGAIQRIRALRELRTVPPIDQLLQRLLDLSGYEAALRLESNQARLDNLAELKRAVAEAAKDPDATLEEFLNQVALMTNLDHAASRETVKLMTVHTAKGLEFPCVFVCGLNEGVFPSRKVVTPDEMDEERRIAYVAFTRAKERLFLSDAEGVHNDNLCKFPSRFLFDAGEENLDCVQPIPAELLQRTRNYIAADEKRLKAVSELFTPGQRVQHQVFGEGTIRQVNLRDACYEIQFEKLPTPRTIRFGTALTLVE